MATTERTSPALTRRFALHRSEAITTAFAAIASTAAYVADGQPYLARGVIGDVVGLGFLAVVAGRFQRRLKHEAAVCLTFIGAVLVARPQWPLRIGEPVWWLLFLLALLPYVTLRRRVCD